jgi:hypothetical protein
MTRVEAFVRIGQRRIEKQRSEVEERCEGGDDSRCAFHTQTQIPDPNTKSKRGS